MRHAATDVLDIAYEEGGPAAEAPVVLLLHGWPDDIRGWRSVAPRLHPSGFRTIAPYLRGFARRAFARRRRGETGAAAPSRARRSR
jgi:pimeloyl-ACP methyl ester carboxylesterase